MKRVGCVLLLALFATGSFAARADNSAPPTQPTTERNASLSEQQVMIDLFNRWERVWREGQCDLAPSCVGDHYIRHDESGDRTVTRDAYVAEIAEIRRERPDIRVIVYDHSFEGDRGGFALLSSGLTPRPARRGAVPVCNPTGSRWASWSRRGCPCSR
jgi:hypothetical protein